MSGTHDTDLARVLGVNRVREEAAEDAAWIIAFWKPLIDAGMDPEHAMGLTQQWLEAHMQPAVLLTDSDECGVDE